MAANRVAIENATNTTITTTDETVVATLTGVSNGKAGGPLNFHGFAKITTGANTTALNLRIRRDSVTGTEVTESNIVQIAAAAGSTEQINIDGEDPLTGEVVNATYVLTAQATAATANATCVYAYLVAESN